MQEFNFDDGQYGQFIFGDPNHLLLVDPHVVISYNIKNGSVEQILSATDTRLKRFNDLYPARNGGTWLDGRGGVIHIKSSNQSGVHKWQWTEYPFETPSRKSAQILFSTVNPRGELAGMGSKLHRLGWHDTFIYVLEEGEWKLKYDVPIHNHWHLVYWDEHDVLWRVDRHNANLIRHLGEQQQILTDNGINPIPASWLDASLDGDIWIASKEGFARVKKHLWEKPPKAARFNGPIYSITKDNRHQLWCLSQNVLLSSSKKRWNTYPLPEILKGETLNPQITPSINTLSNGELLITGDGQYSHISSVPALYVWTVDPIRKQFHVKDMNTIGLQGSSAGTETALIKTLGNRILEFDAHEFSTRYEGSIDSLGIHDGLLYESSEGDIWFAKDKQLCRIQNGTLKTYGKSDGYAGGLSYCMIERSKGTYWFGTQNGIFKYDGQLFKHDLPTDYPIHDLIQDRNNRIWAASKNGIYCYDKNCWIRYDTNDGLTTNYIYCLYEDARGQLWAGTANGLFRFQPGHDADPPETWITEESREYQKSLAHDESLRVEYHGKDRWKNTSENRLFFSTKIDQGEWSAYRPKLEYNNTDVSPGSHQFYVKAMDRNFNVDPTPASFQFTVHWPWYRQPGFLLMSICGSLVTLIAIGYAIHRHVSLERLVNQQSAELMATNDHILKISEREQQRIGYELHDGIVQDLTAVGISGDFLIESLNQKAPEDAGLVKDLIKTVDRSTIQLRRIARGLAPVNLDTVGLIGALEQLTKQVSNYYDTSCRVEYDHVITIKNHEVKLNLYRIAQEAVNNAAKHAEADQIIIRLKEKNEKVELSVIDNGKGIPENQINGEGMGFHIMKYRAKMIQAKLETVSHLQKGTQIICQVPNQTNLT